VSSDPPFVRRYYRVVPGPDDDPPPRPYFRRSYPDEIGPEGRRAIPEDRDWRDQRAALPPTAGPRDPEPQAAPSSATDGTIKTQTDQVAPELRRQIVDYRTKEPAGTIIVDTRNTYLYYVLGDGQAVRYGIGVGREGFAWSGRETVSRMAEWPDWYPPTDMIRREPYLPRMMAGGPGNPLGARALYLGNTLFRIHGTNDASSIGKHVSSGCIRLLNEDIADLYSRVKVGTRVVVLRGGSRPAVARR
jgi:lipoprotein-anchoring transpeptidase ErfK/SrfK